MHKNLFKNKNNNNISNQKNIKKNLDNRYFGKNITNAVLNKKIDSNDNKENIVNYKIKYNNPQLVEEFEDDILKNLKLNINNYDLDCNYLNNQKDINCLMREIIIDWMIDVHEIFGLSQNCLFKSISILDYTLSKKIIKKDKLQLISITSMFISSKYEEVLPIKLKDFILICDSAFSKEEILKLELEILYLLNYKLDTPEYTHFINKTIKVLNLNKKAFYYSNYLIEQSLLNYNMLKFNFFNIISAVFFIVNKLFNKSGWTNNLQGIFNIEENLVIICAKELLKNKTNKQLTAIKRKYSSMKYLEIAKFKIEKI